MTVFDVPLEELRRRRSIKWARFGPDVLPMFVAEMDARPVPAVVEVLSRMVADGDTGYPELPDYQEAFAGFARDVWSWQIDPAEILLAGDVMSGMRELTLATTQPGDAVVINPPVYPPSPPTAAWTSMRWPRPSRGSIPPPTCCARRTTHRGSCTPLTSWRG